MKTEIVKSYMDQFDDYAYKTENMEFWFARDLQRLLDYSKWENFVKVIEKAKIACDKAGGKTDDHFAGSVRSIKMPNGGIKEIDDIILSRYACYLIAQNGNPSKEPVAFAMSYFAIQTRKQEVIEKRIGEWERLQVREKLSLSEKELSGVIYERGVDSLGFALIRSRGDKALFGGHSTSEMKERLGVPKNRSLADFLPTITIKAKDFANEITVFNLKKDNGVRGQQQIANEHENNNSDIRNLLLKRGIRPEELPVEEDAKKLKRRVNSEDKKLLKGIRNKK
ncbi:MAG: DNA damage-inducible protein D [Parcubacteria group bacterium]